MTGKKRRGYKGFIRYDRMGKAVAWFVNDAEVTEAEFHEAFPAKLDLTEPTEILLFQGKTTWPMVSDALAVHPKQVAEANERARRHGLATRYQADGRAVIPSAAEKTKLVNLEGFVDRQKGYS